MSIFVKILIGVVLYVAIAIAIGKVLKHKARPR